jgi:hypothetical protein
VHGHDGEECTGPTVRPVRGSGGEASVSIGRRVGAVRGSCACAGLRATRGSLLQKYQGTGREPWEG